MTTLYFVRHADSPYVEGLERERGLSERGIVATEKVRVWLAGEGIDMMISSPYQRAKDTIQSLADAIGLEIMEEEDLRERKLGDLHEISFADAKRKLYADRNFSLPGGESSRDAQSRAIKVINNILDQYAGKRVVIGTHGDIMTLMLNHFDARFAYEFWQGTSMPDIYRADFEQGTLVNIARLWNEE